MVIYVCDVHHIGSRTLNVLHLRRDLLRLCDAAHIPMIEALKAQQHGVIGRNERVLSSA